MLAWGGLHPESRGDGGLGAWGPGVGECVGQAGVGFARIKVAHLVGSRCGSPVWGMGMGGSAGGPSHAPGPSGDLVRLAADGLRVQEDEDNSIILQSTRDALKLIQNKFLPAVCTWVQVRCPIRPTGGVLGL